MTRATEALEDVIEQLTGALLHTGQALGNAAVAVNLMSSAASEANQVPVYVSPEMIEKELGVEPKSLWPDKYVPDLSDTTRVLLNEAMTMLILTRQGKIELNTGAQKVSARLEKLLGLSAGAIWTEGVYAPNCPNANLLELVRKHEQLLAFIVVQMGKFMDQNVIALLGYLCGKYTQLGFPESIEATTFRHLDTRAAFAKLDEASTKP